MTRPATGPRGTRAARAAGAVLLAAVLLLLAQWPVGPARAASGYTPISGAGSTWSQNAITQWQTNVKKSQMTVRYTGLGSSDGRNQFRNGTVDFAVSEIPYGVKDTGVVDTPPKRAYAYMPIVAGGTSFMYNLVIGNQRVTNLRLSGENLAKIFTGTLTRWNDPAIKRDNPALAARLPARKIVPVVRSDGSGTTAQFSGWLADQNQGLWDAYCRQAGRPTPCGQTSNYPTIAGKGFVAQSGSNGVSGYVATKGNIGTITYVEYSYATESTHFPVVKVLNKAGYYVEPTASNVAVALLKARIEDDESSPAYLTQKLQGVYNDRDPRTYPLSSYSYMILPTKTESNFSENKGRTLGAFGKYFLCDGQRFVDDLGYSPLPKNLVEAGFEQLKRIPGAEVGTININSCRNPTFSSDGTNTLAKNAPFPPACDKQGPKQCTTGTGGATTPTNPGGGSAGGGSASGGSAAGGASGGTAGTAGGTAAAGGTGDAAGGTAIDPDTGQVVNAGTGGSQGGDAYAVPVTTGASISSGLRNTLMVLAGVLLLAVTFGPPLLAGRLDRRNQGRQR
ncbi:phosphate ABC transporter substrate-binding protein PstS [Streptomyces sp. NPDC051940]|uniref:phosphate ABC transporter substrate-binding protein PstS n=1 Tax=Streptomyces sp. NPDC051940 TaxID=3155675 RepID=UPI00341F5114